MGRAAVALVALTASGCAQLFGLDNTTAAAGSDAAAYAPAAQIVSLSFQQLSVSSMLTLGSIDLSAQTATYLIADSTDPSGLRSVPATLGPSGDTWTAD